MDNKLVAVLLVCASVGGMGVGYLFSLNQTVGLPAVSVLNNQDYYYSLKGEIKSAKETIIVAMFEMKYDPNDSSDWANDLINELVNARTRGVDVTVILEYKMFNGYQNDNLAAYQYLLSKGVNARLDNDDTTDHLKLVIMDEDTVYIGSHNWAESSLYYNNETSVKITSKDIADIFKAYSEKI